MDFDLGIFGTYTPGDDERQWNPAKKFVALLAGALLLTACSAASQTKSDPKQQPPADTSSVIGTSGNPNPAPAAAVRMVKGAKFIVVTRNVRLQQREKIGDTRLALMDPGKVSGATYRNDALGFSYEFPSGWHVVDQVAQEKLMDAASRDFYGSADPPPDEHEARTLCIRVLLWTTKYPETARDVNPLAVVLAIVPDCYPGITVPVKDSERMYLREAIEALSAVFTGSSLLGNDDQKIRNFFRHDRNFVQVSTIRTTDARTDRPKKPIHSAVILTQAKGYWLAWLLVSDTHSELQQLQKLKVQFD